MRNKSLRLGDNRRNEVMDEMENSAPMVVDLLKAYLSEGLKIVSQISFAYGCLVCIWLFQLHMVVSFAYGCLVCIWLFHLPMVVWFAYGCLIW